MTRPPSPKIRSSDLQTVWLWKLNVFRRSKSTNPTLMADLVRVPLAQHTDSVERAVTIIFVGRVEHDQSVE